MPRRSVLLLLAPLVFGCRRADRQSVQPPAPDSASVALARAVADSLGDELTGLLAQAMDRGGPALAIHFCADSAQARTLRHWKNGLYIRRVSRRVRNVDDTPDAIERGLLQHLADLNHDGRLPNELVEVIRAADGTWELQYMRPIVVGSRCLACHGDPASLDPAVRAELAQRYPEDRATGYRVGDLRGAVSVRVPLPAPTR
jgi:Protein of unknown function (DUF3365)